MISSMFRKDWREVTGYSHRWTLGSIAVVLSFLVLPFGPTSNQLSLAVIIFAIIGAIAVRKSALSSGLVILSLAISVWWAILFLNPNVINIERAFVGYRVSIVFMLGAAAIYFSLLIYRLRKLPVFKYMYVQPSWVSFASPNFRHEVKSRTVDVKSE